jgi:adenine phosphoribosyltransferase
MGLEPDVQRAIQSCIRVVPDWPKPGILFQDLSGVMADPTAFRHVIDGLAREAREHTGSSASAIDHVIGIEARGFPYGAALAHHLGAGFVAARKPGKLPGPVHARAYELEYGAAALELHRDAVGPGKTVVIVDDVLATGGTAVACADLTRRTGANLVAVVFVMHIPGLGGDSALSEARVPWTALLQA